MKPLETGDPTSLGEGRYRLVGRLGQGGMGVVYLGRSQSGRAVAVKVVRPELSTEPGFKRRFADEVAAARRVGGFHTAPVVDADPDGEPAWLVTAFVPGPTLQAVLARVGSLPLDTLTVLAAGLAEALEAIHRAGVIHRDLKPANIIVAEDGPRVIDFGIARALDGTSLTQTGLQVGTPGFLAPEQLTGGGAVTPAVDMFALGVVLTQAAGGAPFGDGPSAARHFKVVYEEPDLTAVPGELREAIGACLSKDPAARPTPAAFLDTLTVRHPDGGSWLPEAATQLLPPPEPAARPTVPDGPSDTAQDLAVPDAVPPVVAEPRTEQPRTVTGPAARLSPAPAQVPQADTERPRRRRAVVAAVLVASVAVVGLYVWQPWTDSTKDNSKPGAATPTGSAPAPAPFPADPLLIRQDTAPGWPGTCHSVIARRDAATEKPLGLIAGVAGACDTLPQWSPDRRSFAFTRSTPEGTAVWTANADGSNARRITSIAGGRMSWSPDGSQLAVLRKKDGVQQLFVVGVADGTARQLTSGGSQVEDPAWSPDGKSIAVCLQTAPENWQIHLVDPAAPSRAPQQVTRLPHPALDPVWSPDGSTFAYTAGTYGTGTQGDIRLVDADGSNDRELVATSAHEMDPAWSVDGTWVAFVRGPYEKPVIWAVRADKTGERTLTTGGGAEGHPSWR
ncbi:MULTISPECIES: protein kinase domain-containing protein [unclassified Streptomyces]|uniref:protein kinase domain-containing protein n=1 Tax=unclassified Streptomyces TaxID=2593676 RepID=UPI0022527526|nr:MULTISPECIES: protein kinase [unclassified Streptomyces]MCX4632583.1 protein kinase [Streptomyces sp. NBC_01443]